VTRREPVARGDEIIPSTECSDAPRAGRETREREGAGKVLRTNASDAPGAGRERRARDAWRKRAKYRVRRRAGRRSRGIGESVPSTDRGVRSRRLPVRTRFVPVTKSLASPTIRGRVVRRRHRDGGERSSRKARGRKAGLAPREGQRRRNHSEYRRSLEEKLILVKKTGKELEPWELTQKSRPMGAHPTRAPILYSGAFLKIEKIF
jgi:hypothetical protein